MNAINRIGQKVICVAENAIWQYLCETIRTHPIKGSIYTVTGFAPIMGDVPGIHLRELDGFSCTCSGVANAAWPISAFRPLDQRKTDISQFEKLLVGLEEVK
jgi:hypothetical protein